MIWRKHMNLNTRGFSGGWLGPIPSALNTGRWLLLVPGMFLLALAPTAKASFVSGQFAPGATSVEVTGTELIFYNLGVPPPVIPMGMFAIDAPATGSFATLVGDTSTIKDLTDTPADPACVGCIFAPVDTMLGANVFMALPTTGTSIDIEL